MTFFGEPTTDPEDPLACPLGSAPDDDHSLRAAADQLAGP